MRPSFLLPALLLLAGCDKAREPPPSPDGPRAPSSAAPAPRPTGPADVAFEVPAAWTSTKSRPMIRSTYSVPAAPGDAEGAELTVSQAGGTVDQNVGRWAGQLGRAPGDAKRSKRTVSGIEVTLVEIHGDYAGMSMPGAPPAAKKPGFAMLGAIVETSPPTFFKLTGPEKTVMAAQPEFDKLVSALRAK